MGAGPGIGPALVLATVAALPFVLALSAERVEYDIWSGLIWGPVVLLLALPFCRWLSEGDPGLRRFFVAAAFLKLVVGPIARYAATTYFYGALSDADRYDDAAAILLPQLRQGDLTGLGKLSGTRFIEVLTGVVQLGIGEGIIGTFFVFSLFGFIGLGLLYRSFREGLPNADARFCRLLLFLMPTMWFWPSSIGKESVMLLFIGLATFGGVRLLTGRNSGLVPTALGIWGCAVVRPHVALILVGGIVAGFFGPTSSRTRRAERRRNLLGAVAAVVLLVAVVSRVESFFDIESVNVDAVQAVQTRVGEQTNQGSTFDSPDPNTPVGYGLAVVTVIVRPFPWEAPGSQGLLSSAEGIVIVGLCVVRRRSIGRALVGVVGDRVLRFYVATLLLFIYAFAALNNFGNLSRQRSQIYPFLFFLLAFDPRPRTRSEPPSSSAPDAEVQLT